MLELGDASPEAHKNLGRFIGTLKVSGVYLLGEHATEVAAGAIEAKTDPDIVRIAKNHREIVSLLKGVVRPGDWILVKGSRRMRMENVIDLFREGA